jgi:hypothetical protein
MVHYIDVFYTPENRTHTYITFVIDPNGAVITSRTHQHIDSVVEWCKRQQLPARSSSALVREELIAHGVEVQNQAKKGNRVMVDDTDSVQIFLPREQANLLRQLLTTVREWGEGGRSTIRYLFAAYSEWLDLFDQELARALSDEGTVGTGGVLNNKHIDIFYNEHDYHTPYQAWVWNAGRVVQRASYLNLDQIATFCKQFDMSVVSNDPKIRAELRTYGLNVRAPAEKELGNQ